ncbi:MAG: hypothetical protein IBX39_08990 [Candidatus Methanoperedenaceae archaeon]|nr:hypothetical protein [Candidatus Methanoperedenaceae archaeon]MDW7726035.1 hypothetical protein [Candidatus Methanoperedens sp.]
MVEETGKILGNGFGTYTRNVNIAVPFILNLLATGIFTIVMFVAGVAAIFGSSLSDIESVATPEEILMVLVPMISQNITEIVLLGIIFILVYMLIQSFFTAGAIGMARQATETGTSDLSTMINDGKKNAVNLYLANILAGLFMLAGIVFLVPGALKGGISLSSPDTGAVLLLVIGILLWAAYMLVLSIVLALYSYALVVENLGPIDGIIKGVDFFRTHKFDVLLLWIIQIAAVIILSITGEVMALVPVIGTVWSFIGMFISVAVIAPLTTIWWVRLYMSGTGKKLYFNELLLHPNDLGKLETD